jgi:hypothetical protein
MHRNAKIMMLPCVFLVMMLPATTEAQQRREKQELEYPEYWLTRQGDRMRQELPYLADVNPRTTIRSPLTSRVWQKKFIVDYKYRGEMLRIERKEDYISILILTNDDLGHKGRIALGGPKKLELKNLVLFFGQKKSFGNYSLYEEIRAFNDPDVEKFPVVVIRMTGPDSGVVYLDPMGTGTPQAIVNLASAPARN